MLSTLLPFAGLLSVRCPDELEVFLNLLTCYLTFYMHGEFTSCYVTWPHGINSVLISLDPPLELLGQEYFGLGSLKV